eukprot:403337669
MRLPVVRQSLTENQQEVMRQMRDSNYFRSLNGKEEEAVSIQDNRLLLDQGGNTQHVLPNNKLIILCDHASNDVKYSKLEPHEEELMRSNEAFDVGAAEIAGELSERTKCLSVYSNFSKLLIDQTKPLISQDLIREYYKLMDEEGFRLPVSMNHQGYRFYERLDYFYLEYHKIILEIMEYLEPEYILNVHTHDPEYVTSTQKDIILYHPNPKSIMMRTLEKKLIECKLDVEVREKIPSNDPEFCSPMILENLINYYPDRRLDGCYISINNNRLLFEKEWAATITIELSRALKQFSV